MLRTVRLAFRFVPVWVSAPLFYFTLVAGSLVASDGTPASDAAVQIDFNRDIRPILSNHCFRCHGPDGGVREGGGSDGLRLDTPSGILEDLGGYSAVLPGKPDESHLILRVTSQDASELMPPPEAGPRLAKAEVDLLRRWIQQGAQYSVHWSYVAPQRPPIPELEGEAAQQWVQTPIDRFILQRLNRDNLEPQPLADPYTLIRRVALDVTGLPPSSQEVQQFVSETSPDAYERMVDRQLAKESYGEHWARMWLDLARYADSAGYADDPARTIWAYRDYVIRAFNQNMPFDQFTIEQIAGDLLPHPTSEQMIATAFHRNTLTNNEGGTNDEEFRNVAVVDRVNTTYAVWMGTTMACAQCHSHKYDPLSQREYFQSFALFNNSEDADLGDESPLYEVWPESQLQTRQKMQQDLAESQLILDQMTPELELSLANWERSLPRHPRWYPPQIVSAVSEGKVGLQVDPAANTIRSQLGATKDNFEIEFELDSISQSAGKSITAIRLEALADPSLPGGGPGWSSGNFVLSEIRATIIPPSDRQQSESSERIEQPGSQSLSFAAAIASFSQDGFPASSLLANPIDFKTGWAVGGATGQNHQLTLVTSQPVPVLAGSRLKLLLSHQSPHAQHVLGKFRIELTDSTQTAAWASIPVEIQEIILLPESQRIPEQHLQLRNFYRTIAPELEEVRQRVTQQRAELAALKPTTTVPIMRELPAGRQRLTKIQNRGNFLDLGDEVTPDIPEIFRVQNAEVGDRLDFAKWLVSRNNPLTARVAVNRYWEQLFGTGLVATAEEFGSQGDLPTHPELLDWLAVELMDSGWNVKHLLKLMLMSATYRQNSKVAGDLAQSDPENRLLARGPRFRLPAETIRDQTLAVAGLLSRKMYGPPVKPPQPTLGLAAAFGSSTDWQTSGGEDRYRRGIYTTWRRSNPYPSMSTFDAPNREVCTLRRVRTNTPLQALVTLNDPVYIEAAQAFGRAMIQEAGNLEQKLELALSRALTRPVRSEEVGVLRQLYDQTLVALQEHPDEASKLATDPVGSVPEGMPVVELAAWTVVANSILNLDEFLMRR